MEQPMLMRMVGLGLTLVTLAFTGFANMKDWFSVPQGLRSPVFGLWYVCFDDKLTECTDPTTETQYGYNSAINCARVFITVAIICLTMLSIVITGAILNSSKVISTAFVFPILAGIAFVCLLVACPIVEGAVRLKVTSYLTITNQPRIDSVTGWAGGCAWTAFACSIVNLVTMVLVYVMTTDNEESQIWTKTFHQLNFQCSVFYNA